MINLLEIFHDLNGLSFIGLTAETIPKLTGGKKNPMQGRVVKRSVMAGMVYTNSNTNSYVNLVVKEIPDFKVSERRWGTRIPNTCVVEHKGNHYLEMVVQSVKETSYFLDGELIKKSEIEGLPVSKPSTTHSVIIRDFKAESIKSIRYNKEEYTS